MDESKNEIKAIWNDRNEIFWLGSEVQLKHNPFLGTAKIESFIFDVKGGVVLDRYLDSFRCWNVEDLQLVKNAGPLPGVE